MIAYTSQGGVIVKTVIIKMDEDLYFEAKIKSLKEKKTFKDYVIDLINADLAKEKDVQP